MKRVQTITLIQMFILYGCITPVRLQDDYPVIEAGHNGGLHISTDGNISIVAGHKQPNGKYSSGIRIQDSPLLRSWNELKVKRSEEEN
jgi:hypothetical protein